jgi:peptidyl-prolyl cis-trans isomerase SurA
MKPGDISEPLNYTDERQRKAVRLIYLKTQTEPHRENLKDDYNKVAQRALDEKKQQVLEKWFRDHIPTYYINIDKEFANCKSISPWWNAANNTASK